ncbi:hypothetical protein QZM46_06075 [Burkholderia vietnamiensis]|uniref:STM2901 family protein n=1 Tax=Burkholderia TaxID=32008 RepID=UPI0005D76224|nr:MULTISPECIES: hypothetical protein [Burkholderia]AJY06178.1 putative membrane protein [Burkholderia vietnamiensis LMG 10929]AOK11004.1 hypothetical protein WK31_12560 [Burkholderia vietnamiensis]AVR16490.1 hypothetical protein A8H33_24470 [Burkholderia vietnamiensis]KVF07003.1 hypothetical protein WJ04_15120 [Burkholderia vietnamiensis]KVF30799.1 hypothetical protein WJ08_15275 [Burkholderia vietnamiensis]
MSENRYRFGIHQNLRPVDLFVYVALDETQKQLGLDDLGAAAAVLLGQADVPAPGKFVGATAGTSVASLAARKLLPFKVAVRLPMITGVGLSGIRVAFTRNLGAWVGRLIPVAGEMFLAVDVVLIMRNTVMAYNRVVKPEDRVL